MFRGRRAEAPGGRPNPPEQFEETTKLRLELDVQDMFGVQEPSQGKFRSEVVVEPRIAGRCAHDSGVRKQTQVFLAPLAARIAEVCERCACQGIENRSVLIDLSLCPHDILR